MENYGGSMVQPGKWVNLHTGHEVLVRDTIQDGDQMMVITDSGQIPMRDFTNYIQIEEGETIPSLQDVYGSQVNLQAQINQGIPTEDRISLNDTTKPTRNSKLLEGLGNQKSNNIEKPKEENVIPQPINENKNYDLIKKVFDKFPVERSLEFYIVEEEWPFKEFNMLVNILDVPVEDICSYVIDNYLNKGKLVEALTQYFTQFIK